MLCNGFSFDTLNVSVFFIILWKDFRFILFLSIEFYDILSDNIYCAELQWLFMRTIVLKADLIAFIWNNAYKKQCILDIISYDPGFNDKINLYLKKNKKN